MRPRKPTQIGTILALILTSFSTKSFAETITIEAVIKSIDPKSRSITIANTNKTNPLEIKLEKSKKAKIITQGKETQIEALKPGQKAKVTYENVLEMTSKIDTADFEQSELEKIENGTTWKFWDTFGVGATPEKAFIVSQNGEFISTGQVKGYHLATVKKYSEFTLSMEFLFQQETPLGNPFIGIASSLPNPNGENWMKQMPFGIELKLNPKLLGQLTLPPGNFPVQLSKGQSRDAKDPRTVFPIRKANIATGEWNTLEIKCDKNNSVTAKINGIPVNSLAKAKTTTGHIIISPPNTEFRIRNAVINSDKTETKLSFEKVE